MRTFLALLLVLIATGPAFEPSRQLVPEDDRGSLAAQLSSTAWTTRSEALRSAMALGWEGRNLVLLGLADRADIISRRAQAWFVDQGEPSVHYLADVLARGTDDSGLYASVVDGKEADVGRSISGTLWLTIGRGLPRHRALAVLRDLVRHASPRVRAVAVFAAGTLRSRAFMDVVAAGATDAHPLVRRRYREALVRLLTFEWYTTPELDEATTARALDLLESELPAILEDETPAVFMGGLGSFVLGDAIGSAALAHHRHRLMAMLERAVPRLTPAAAARAGRIIERQAWTVEGSGGAPNALWVTTRTRDREALDQVRARFSSDARTSRPQAVSHANWAALAALPVDRLDDATAEALFTSSFVMTDTATSLAVRMLAPAATGGNERRFQRALAIVNRSLADADRALATAVLLYEQLVSSFDDDAPEGLRRVVSEVVTREADRLYAQALQAPPSAQCSVVGLLMFADDDRHFALFQEAWKRRPDLALADCVRLVARHGDPRVVPYLMGYLHAREFQDDLKAAAADALLRAPLSKQTGLFTDATLAGLLEVAADAEVHPRTRATLAKLVELPGLTDDQRRAAISVVLRNTQSPHEFNLRAKSCRSLASAGVSEAKAPCMALTLLADAPYWVAANAISGLHALAKRREAGPEEVIDILVASLALYPPGPREIRLLQPGNYYHWGVMYQVHPPFAVLTGLRAATGKDFGLDLDGWRTWQRQVSPPGSSAAVR